MANNLTGDFDVVAEFSIPGVDRMLAAMHQAGRFFHSVSVHVDDNPHPSEPVKPTLVGVVNELGEAVANQQQIGRPALTPGPAAATNVAYALLNPLVNPGALVFGQHKPQPSHIQGRAQLQLSPPTLSVPDSSGRSVAVTMNVMSRFFPDAGSAPLAEFIRGTLQITAAVDQIATERARIIDVNLKADDVAVHLNVLWSSQALSAADLMGIDLCIRNGLRTSFLPSSVPLPAYITDVGFKTLPGAVAVMLDLNNHPSTVSSVTTVFLSGADDFAFAVGGDYIFPIFNSISGNIHFEPISVDVPIWGQATYTNSLTAPPSLDLQDGAVVLTIQAHAHSNKSRFPSFNFTTRISFTLNLVAIDASGRLGTAELSLADVSLDFTDSGIEGLGKDLLLSLFRGRIIDTISADVEQFLNPPDPQPTDLQPIIRQMLNVDTNLGNLLNTLLIPGQPQRLVQPSELQLAYTSVDIRPAGVVLHGSLTVKIPQPVEKGGRRPYPLLLPAGWPPPYVEFEQIPGNAITGALAGGPDYSALKSWIPGGTIAQYEWSMQGEPAPFAVDPNRFVLLNSVSTVTPSGPSASARISYSPLCLTIRGTRISPSGPETYQPVSATVCGYSTVPVISNGLLTTLGGVSPAIALTQSGKDGLVDIIGYTAAQMGKRGGDTPNLLVHFADEKSANQLDVLSHALGESKRQDAATAIVALLPAALLVKTPYTPGVIYGNAQDKTWFHLFGGKDMRTPFTAIVTPDGKAVWQHEGPLDRDLIANTLQRYLMRTGPIALSLPQLNLRIGQPAPDFLFDLVPGRQLPLRKLGAATLVFWKSVFEPSVAAVRELQAMATGRDAATPTVLAINDGEPASLAQLAASTSGITAIVVIDPRREISKTYGVQIWPTIVTVDASGAVSGIRYGYAVGVNAGTKE